MRWLVGALMMLLSTLSFAQNVKQGNDWPIPIPPSLNNFSSGNPFGDNYSNEIQMMYGRPKDFNRNEFYYNTASIRVRENGNIYYYDNKPLFPKVVVSKKEIYTKAKASCER